MSVTYSTNLMGPAYTDWYKERDIPLDAPYCCGRIDIRDSSKNGYDGWDEYGLAPMPEEDWNALGAWLEDLETEDVWPYDKLVAEFEKHYGQPIQWWEDFEANVDRLLKEIQSTVREDKT